jgi:DNA-binding MarR family transcriptional regulator
VAVARLGVTQTRAHSAAARAAGVNPTSWAILSELSLDGWLTNGQLAERLGMSTGGVTPALDRLVKLGYLERNPNPADRRSSIIAITPEGQRVLSRTTDALAAHLEQAIEALDEGEREATLRFLLEANDAYLAVQRLVDSEPDAV